MYNRKVKNDLRAHARIRRKYEQQNAKASAFDFSSLRSQSCLQAS